MRSLQIKVNHRCIEFTEKNNCGVRITRLVLPELIIKPKVIKPSFNIRKFPNKYINA